MSTALVLYEDRHWSDLRPLTDLLPVPALAFGASDLATRWQTRAALPLLAIEARAPQRSTWSAAPAATIDPASVNEALVFNAAARPGPWLSRALETRSPALFLGDGRIVGARLPMALLAPGLGRGGDFEAWLLSIGLPAFPLDVPFLRWPWDLIEHNPQAIVDDLDGREGALRGELHAHTVVLRPDRVTVEAGARVDAFAVLDAREGPILLGPGVQVLSHTLVVGPCAIGAGTQLLGGVIGRSSIGPECRIAGEVDACVWQGHANKRHHGFVGHSVIGEWVNLGALTTTSDLKNNYGEVRVWVGDRERESGSTKVGSLLGAHVKTGIGTLLPTGASVGTGANLFGGGRFAPKRVPSFGWWDGEHMLEHQLDPFIATARMAMSRRQRTLLPADEALLRALHEQTRKERA